MNDRRAKAETIGRRSARGMHVAAAGAGHVATLLDRTADGVDRVAGVIGHVDRPTVTRALATVQHPRRRALRTVAAFAAGALVAVAIGRLWRHLRTRETPAAPAAPPANLDWHVDRSGESWQVLDPRAPEPHSVHRTQADAVASAERALAAEGGGDLVVHALDGRPREVLHIAPSYSSN